jgi:hypothetical protein
MTFRPGSMTFWPVTLSLDRLIVGGWNQGGNQNRLASLQQIYVALSRVRSTNGLILLEPLPQRAVFLRMSAAITAELQRLKVLGASTHERLVEGLALTGQTLDE